MFLLLSLFMVDPTVTIQEVDAPLNDVLRSFEKQTGLRPRLTFEPKTSVSCRIYKQSPWMALDHLAAQLRSRVDLSDRAVVRLVPLREGERLPPTVYDGPLRFQIVEVTSQRDLVRGEGKTTVGFEIAWLPTYRPIFFESEPQCTFFDRAGRKLLSRESSASLVPTTNRGTMYLNATIPVLPRTDAEIARIEGKITAVVLRDLLTFAYATTLDRLLVAPRDGEQRQMRLGGILCTVDKITLARERWSLRMQLDYPEGANRDFESYQAGSMVIANELVLVSVDGKRRLAAVASVAEETSARRTVVTFHFVDTPTQKRGTPETWTLRYVAPSGVVDRSFSFTFENVPLP
ncbi:MAG: hypothetical protein SNJ75_11815 [Gemmataceae bacterium]